MSKAITITMKDSHCKDCGYEFADNMRYCPYCGIKRRMARGRNLWD